MVNVTTIAPEHRRSTSAKPAASTGAVAGWATGLAVVSVIVGVVLGEWCRRAALQRSPTSWNVSAELSLLGSPWVCAAVLTGALGAAAAKKLAIHVKVALLAGAVAATVTELVAVAVYYRAGVTTVLPFSTITRVTGWGVAGVATGIVFGALGAVWAFNRTGPRARLAAVAVGSVITAEAALRLARDLYLGAVGPGSIVPASAQLLVPLAIIGLVVGAVGAGPRHRLGALVVTGAVCAPAALVIVILYRSINVR